MKIGIVGSRNFTSEECYSFMKKKYEDLYSRMRISNIVSGGGAGADTLAERLAKEYSLPIIIHHAKWGVYGDSAGPKRNSLIVRDSDEIIAFPSADSRGTWDTVNKARKRGIKCSIFDDWEVNRDSTYSIDSNGYVIMKFPILKSKCGEVRIGRIEYKHGKPIHPSYPGFRPIVVMTESSEYGSLGPYVLKDDKGRILENVWQFSKVYPNVPASIQRYSRWNNKIIWQHPAEVHVREDGVINKQYWEWREKGMNSMHPIRYPVGKKHMSKCIYALKEKDGEFLKRLDYISARKEIYVPIYLKAVVDQPQFRDLKEMIDRGDNLLIIEIDGPHGEHLDYYKQNYATADDFIVDNTMIATPENLKIMLEDDLHPYGHGYCLGMALKKISLKDLDALSLRDVSK